jgi:uncharacterized RmlC-like cupin family protein
MKKLHAVLIAGILFCLFSHHTLHAQNFSRQNPSFVRMLADTSFATVMEVTFQPGVATTSHTHPAQFLYALTDGSLHIVHGDGKVEDITLKMGDNFLFPPLGPHVTTNRGPKPFTMLVVEFNDHPYKKMKK